MLRFVTIALAFALFLAASAGVAAADSPAAPPTPIFDARQYGAKGDGTTNDHDALQRAIDACKTTGGSVVLRNGKYLTGQLTLGSKMTLFIAPTATLLGVQSMAETDYPTRPAATDNHMNGTCQRRLLWGENLADVTITGGGTIDGQNDFGPWHGKVKVPERLRPSILEFSNCTNVTVTNVTLHHPACWTEVYLECTGVTLRNLRVDTGKAANNLDGVDICDCHHVLIEDCDIHSQDDGICFKSGNAVGCRDITVRRCAIDKLGLGAGNGIKFGTPTFGSFADVLIEDVTIRDTENSAITWECVDGGEVKNVEVRNCTITRAAQAISVLLGDRNPPTATQPAGRGRISHLIFRNIRATEGTKPMACLISGTPGNVVTELQFVDVTLQVPGGVAATPPRPKEYAGGYPEGTHFGDLPASGFFVRHADGVTFTHCTVTPAKPDARPWLAVFAAENVIVKRRAKFARNFWLMRTDHAHRHQNHRAEKAGQPPVDFLDGVFAFGVNLNVVAKFHLHEGQQLSSEDIAAIEAGSVRQECFDHAMRFIEKRMQSRRELQQKLTRSEYGPAVIESVLDQLTELNYVNDARFAESRAESAATYKHHGPNRARIELARKGVDRETARRAVEEVYETHDNMATARDLARKKMKLLARLEPHVARRRLMGMLLRRGFDFDTIKPVIEEALGGFPNDAPDEESL